MSALASCRQTSLRPAPSLQPTVAVVAVCMFNADYYVYLCDTTPLLPVKGSNKTCFKYLATSTQARVLSVQARVSSVHADILTNIHSVRVQTRAKWSDADFAHSTVTLEQKGMLDGLHVDQVRFNCLRLMLSVEEGDEYFYLKQFSLHKKIVPWE